MKKILSLALACIMILTMVVSMPAFADGEVTISSTTETVIELDEYTYVNGNKVTPKSYSGASKGTCISANGSGYTPSVEATVTVGTTGFYDIEYVMAGKAGNTSTINVYLGETLICSNTDEGGTQVFYTAMGVHKFNKSKVPLTAGTYTLKLTVACDADNGTTHRYAFDYIKFTPLTSADETINLDDITTIELEEYTTVAGNPVTIINDDSVADGYSGDGYIGADGEADAPSTRAYISVAESGNYEIEYVLSEKLTGTSTINVYLGDTLIGSNTETDGSLLFTSKIDAGVYKFKKTSVPLTKGIYELKIEIASDASDNSYRWAMDYISFGPLKTDARISLATDTVIDLDTYATVNGSPATAKTEVAGGNENDYVAENSSEYPPVVSASVTVRESGTYSVEYISIPQSTTVNKFSYYLGETLLGTNDDSGVAVDTEFLSGYSTAKYTKTVDLTAGVYYLTVVLDATASGNYSYMFDYIKFSAYEEVHENTVVLVKDEVANYMKTARKTYATDEYADYTSSIISNYLTTSGGDIPKPVKLSWDVISGATSYTLLISETEDFSKDVLTISNISTTSYDVYNLKVCTEYYWKVKSGTTESAVSSFYTDRTSRYIFAEGARNIRDIGGWNGLNQGMAFRGSELDLVDSHGLELTEAGKKVMHDDLGIRTDLDFRVTDLTKSPIGDDVKFINDYRIGGYSGAFTSAKYAGLIRTFADADNYPIYFHCWGGADRTGTVAFILEALCGASEADLSVDFELTSFSIFGVRPRYDTADYQFASTVKQMLAYSGSTIQEKAENYCLNTLGLTPVEIANIQSLLAGSKVVFANSNTVAAGRKNRIVLENVNGHTISAVTINGSPMEYTMVDSVLTVDVTEEGEGIITFDDGNVLPFTASEVSGCEVQNLSDGFTRLLVDDTDWIGGEAYRFPVTVNADADFAVFLGKDSEEVDGFSVRFIKDDTEINLATNDGATGGYAYPYVRVGAGTGDAGFSVALTAGNWVMEITPSSDINISYIDFRSTEFSVSGEPVAIYPSDFNSYQDEVSNIENVNGKIGSISSEKLTGYFYYGDYANDDLDTPFEKDRQIYFDDGKSVSYKLNVKTAGTYTITATHNFNVPQALRNNITATVTAAVNGSTVHTKTQSYVAGETGESTIDTMTFTVTLSAGEQILSFAAENADSCLYHLTVEGALDSGDKCVTADNNLTRIEVNSENNVIAAGCTRGFAFTVPVDGNYNFYGNIGTSAMDMKVVLKDLQAQSLATVYDGTLSRLNPTYLRRLGMGKTASVPLKANVKYCLYLAPSVDTTVTFIDVMNVALEINGKTVASPIYYSGTDIADAQINCSDQKNKITPESGYTLAGNFLDDELAAQTGFNTGYAVTPHVSNGLSVTYTLNVKKAAFYKIAADVGAYATSYLGNDTLEFTVDGTDTATAQYTLTGDVQRLTGPSVYLSEGVHTLKLKNPTGGNAGYYLHQLLFTPVTDMKVTVSGLNVIVCAGYAENADGEAFIALYNAQNNLVGIHSATVTNGESVLKEIAVSDTPTKAKFFIWKAKDNPTPLKEHLEITYENSNWNEA